MKSKKYYWLKLHENFFDDLTIKMIEKMSNGIQYTNFLMKLYLKSLRNEGKMLFRDTIPYDEEMLSVLTGVDVDIVRSSLAVFFKFGIIERWDDGTLYISEVQSMIGSESESTKRVRKHRQQQKALQCNTDSLHCNADETKRNADETKCNTEIEKEKELEIDIYSTAVADRCVQVVKLWDKEFSTNTYLDSALERLIRERLGEYSTEDIARVFSMYSTALSDADIWVKHKKTLFGFLQNSNYGFSYFFHSSIDELKGESVNRKNAKQAEIEEIDW